MSKIEEAKQILRAFGLPAAQQNEMAAVTLLALCDIKESDNWKNAERNSLTVSKGIMTFAQFYYKKKYAPNTRETFRRQVLHQLVQAGIVDYNPDNPNLPVNSPKVHYAISASTLEVIKKFGTGEWNKNLKKFITEFGELKDRYSKEREINQIPVKLSNGKELLLSAGKHNEIQASVINQFIPRFAANSVLLYLSDAAKKDLYSDDVLFKELEIPLDQHGKLPDIIIYDKNKGRIFLVEAVTSHGPVSPKRIIEMEELLKNCKATKIYITAFPTYTEFRKYLKDIAWETEVWIMEFPDHMIHFNGEKFLG